MAPPQAAGYSPVGMPHRCRRVPPWLQQPAAAPSHRASLRFCLGVTAASTSHNMLCSSEGSCAIQTATYSRDGSPDPQERDQMEIIRLTMHLLQQS